MGKKKVKEKKSYWVPMKWEYSGGAWVEATSAEEAVEKAEAGDFAGDVSLHDAGASLVDWEVTGDAEPR